MNMIHEALLADFLRDICETGVGRIEKRVLLRWYGQQKMSRGIWRDLQQRFHAALLDEGDGNPQAWRLLAVEPEDGHLSFAAVDMEDISKNEGWWEFVDVRASRAQQEERKSARKRQSTNTEE